MPCQDRLVAEAVPAPDGEILLIAAVADGASFAVYGATGAELAVDGFIDCVLATLRDVPLRDVTETRARGWIEAMRETVRAEAEREGRDPVDYACTYLAAVIGAEAAIFLQIGDGVIAAAGEGADWALACTPQHGEHINETRFLIDPDAVSAAEIRILSTSVQQLALMSDGLEPVCLDRGAAQVFAPFLSGLMHTLTGASETETADLTPALERYLSSPAINAQTSDDKALVLATRWPLPPG